MFPNVGTPDDFTISQTRIFVLTVWAYPLFPLVMAIGAWIAFARRKDRLAAVLSGLTFAPPVLFYLFLWVATLIGP
jgi:cytochrome c-type biogenesis protein CcmH/NrfF